MTTLVRTACFGMVLTISASLGFCTTYYVSPRGDDGAAGTSAGGAWRTVQEAVQRVRAGDVVVLADGVYSQMVRLDGVKFGEQPITLRAENVGRAVIDADGAMYCVGTDGECPRNLVLEGLVLRNAGMGVGLDAGAEGLTIRQCEITRTLEAVRMRSGSALSISDSRVHDNENGILIGVKGKSGVRGVRIERTICTNNAQEGRTGNRDGILVEEPSTEVVIRDCVSSGAGDSGFDLKPDGTTVERCRGFGNGQWGVKLWGSGCSVINCLMYGNDLGGIGAGGKELRFWNCTFGPNGKTGLRVEKAAGSACVIGNCVFYQSPLQCLGPALPDEDYNCYYAAADGEVVATSEQAYTVSQVARHPQGIGKHDLARDPLFAKPSEGDYRLTSGSPCRGAGLWDALIEVDLLGQRRSSPPDIGALQS